MRASDQGIYIVGPEGVTTLTAFLSHSSKDKAFVRQVAAELGSLSIEFDESTFEFILNVQAIRQALRRSSVVVFFVSQQSISSNFVAEEQRQTLEALGRGDIKRVLIFTIDATSYNQLPKWMQEINIVQRATNAKSCARRIKSVLVEVDAHDVLDQIYVGREDEESKLRKALAAPRDRSPLALHVTGFHGIGRRTYLRKSLSRLLPRYYDGFLEVEVSRYQGVEDLYRSLYSLEVVSSLQDTIRDLQRFDSRPLEEQCELASKLIRQIVSDGNLLVVVDDFGVFDEEGDYHDYWKRIINLLSDIDRPALGFIQSRTQPFKIRSTYARSFHIRLEELSETNSRDLIALSLREDQIDFTESELRQLGNLVDGHPFNLRFVVGYARHYGLESFLKDPRDYIEWKHRRGEDFLKKLTLSPLEIDIIAALAEYRHLSADLLLAISGADLSQLMDSIRVLQDFCCVDFRSGFFTLASPIREASRRDLRFKHDDEWHERLAQLICDTVSEYTEEDDVPLSILEAATFAQARGATAPAYLKSLVLPSHFLKIAREHYDMHLRPQCIEFCKRAYEMKSRMTSDAQVETLRLWGLSAARSNEPEEFDFVISELRQFHNVTAKRVLLFLEGFQARLKGRLDLAERRFKDAWELAPRNAHINRELASLYCRQSRYNEAEQFARSSYEIQKTNTYIIDILLETLIGKKQMGHSVDEKEIDRLTQELQTHSIESDTIFYNLRETQRRLGERDYDGAASEVQKAIQINPEIPAAYFLGVEAEIGRRNVAEAENYLEQVRNILRNQGVSEGDECKIVSAEVDIQIEKRQYLLAKTQIDRARNLPGSFIGRKSVSLARAIMYDAKNATSDLKAWANTQLSSGQ